MWLINEQMGCVPSKTLAIIKNFNSDEKPPFLIQTIEDHKLGVNCLDISEDRSLLVSGGEDCIARLWSTLSNPCECIGILSGHEVQYMFGSNQSSPNSLNFVLSFMISNVIKFD